MEQKETIKFIAISLGRCAKCLNRQKKTYGEWQQQTANMFEIVRNGEQIMNDVLNANASMFAQMVFNQFIWIDCCAFAIDSEETMFEDQIANGLNGWIAIHNVRFN